MGTREKRRHVRRRETEARTIVDTHQFEIMPLWGRSYDPQSGSLRSTAQSGCRPRIITPDFFIAPAWWIANALYEDY
jgi:hypothetical protein